MIKFRDYQKQIIDQGVDILKRHKFVYLAMEVRTGKTLTSLGMLDKMMSVNNVLFLTKKKAMSSISKDYEMMCPASFSLFIINYESIHKAPNIKWDAIVLDEAHGLGAFPKPSKRAKDVKNIITKDNPLVVLMSGTPTPESYSQMYHQVYGIPNNPFKRYSSFYRFCDDYVNVKVKVINLCN